LPPINHNFAATADERRSAHRKRYQPRLAAVTPGALRRSCTGALIQRSPLLRYHIHSPSGERSAAGGCTERPQQVKEVWGDPSAGLRAQAGRLSGRPATQCPNTGGNKGRMKITSAPAEDERRIRVGAYRLASNSKPPGSLPSIRSSRPQRRSLTQSSGDRLTPPHAPCAIRCTHASIFLDGRFSLESSIS
jgi:hypothetical protein